jgi:hypothetical protein
MDRIAADCKKSIAAHPTKNNAVTDNKLDVLDKGLSASTDKLEQFLLQAPANENN